MITRELLRHHRRVLAALAIQTTFRGYAARRSVREMAERSMLFWARLVATVRPPIVSTHNVHP